MVKFEIRKTTEDGRLTTDERRWTERFWFLIITVILFSSLVLLPSSFVYASVPHLINYQGRLTDTSGAPLNGPYNITFRLYDAETAGDLLWQGTYTGASITKGIFSILLGDVSDSGFNFSNLAFDKSYWLEIKVGTDDPMAPRQRITSAGYAITAERLVDNPLPTARGGTGTTANANSASGVLVLDANRKLPAVDGSQLTGMGFGSWVSRTDNTVYQAETDGFFIILIPRKDGTTFIYSDTSNPPSTLRMQCTWGSSICPIRKGDYYKGIWDSSSGVTCFWISLGK